MKALPGWAEFVLLPLLDLAMALAAGSLAVLATGQNPLAALASIVQGAFGSQEAIGYTLYYATDMIFAGLSVAIAFHCGLFNIGVEGQAYVAGLGVALSCLHLDFLPQPLVIACATAAAALFGAAWAAIPGWLQARRGSHVVITTIMFNFISYSLLAYLLVNVLIVPGSMAPQTRDFAPGARMPQIADMLAAIGVAFAATPLNLAFVLALLCLVAIWLFLWHTRAGYRLRVTGQSPQAARYGGIDPGGWIIIAMLLSGALAGGIALNEVMGAQHKLQIGFTSGYGFTGIAVALMGRNHPFGVLLAALLFGALYQGGAELAFDMPNISGDLVVALQGLVILFTGALGGSLRPLLVRTLRPSAA